MNGQVFIKSFSKGQITIPKVFRDKLGIRDDFWLKMVVSGNKLIAEPVSDESRPKDLADKLLNVKGDWFSLSDWKKTRAEVSQRLNAD